MSIQTMYEGIVNSPETIIIGGVSTSDTVLFIDEIASLPPAPNLAVLGYDTDNPETILYMLKYGNSITEVVRGFEGEVQEWDSSTKIARVFTSYDHDTFKANIDELNTGKSDINHTHSGTYEPIFSKNNAFNKNFGTTSGTVTQGNDSRLSNDRTPLSHGNEKHNAIYATTSQLFSGSYIDLSNVPSTFTPSAHTHSYLPLSGGVLTNNLTLSSGAAGTAEIILDISNAGSPQISISDTDGDNYWSVGTDDADNNFSIHGSTTAQQVINNIVDPHFEITTSGVLKNNGNNIATESWVNASADVPNADYADGATNAANAHTVDNKHYADIQSWVNTSADVPNADYADNANLLDGEHASAFANTSHTHDAHEVKALGNRLTVDSDGKIRANSTSYRRAGMYGTYSSTEIGHVWSMGSAYEIDANGATFGDLYGIAYKHTNNPTGGTMAGGHQAVFCNGGSPGSAIGFNGGIWTKGSIYANSNDKVATETWVNAIVDGYEIQKNGTDGTGVINFKTV